jgi:glycerol-3-phosphate O-acyltransferase
LAKDLIREV